MRTNDALSGAVAAALGAALIVASTDLNPLPRQVYGAGTFPKVVGGLLLLLGGIMLLKGLHGRQPWLHWKSDVPIRSFVMGLGAVSASVVAYILLTPTLGFPIVAWGILFLLFQAYYRRGWVRSAGISAVTTGVIWGAFAQVLHVPLEPGILEPVLY